MAGRQRSTPASVAERRARRAEIQDSEVVMEAAAAFLAVRPRSVAETRRRLRHLGYPHALVDGVVDRLIEMRYLDDEQFARSWVESRDRARPRGESALRRELALKGIDRETVRLILEQRSEGGGETADGDPSAQEIGADRIAAEHLIERRRAALMRETDPRKRRQRAYALLARNGFDPEVCRVVSSSLGEGSSAGEIEDEPEPA